MDLVFQDVIVVNGYGAPAVAEAACQRKIRLPFFGFPEGGGASVQHFFVGKADILQHIGLIQGTVGLEQRIVFEAHHAQGGFGPLAVMAA